MIYCRFSTLFSNSTIDTKFLEGEFKAIDGEMNLKKKNKRFKALSIISENSNDLHPDNYVSIGNMRAYLEIQKNHNLSSLLNTQFSDSFSADRMALVVVSPLDIEHVKSMVVKYFSTIARPRHPKMYLDSSRYVLQILPEHMVAYTLTSEPMGSSYIQLSFLVDSQLQYWDSSVSLVFITFRSLNVCIPILAIRERDHFLKS